MLTYHLYVKDPYPLYLFHLGFSEKTCLINSCCPINMVKLAKVNRSNSTGFIAKTKCFPIDFDAHCSFSSFIVDISSVVHHILLLKAG